jgi:hypothetical protein
MSDKKFDEAYKKALKAAGRLDDSEREREASFNTHIDEKANITKKEVSASKMQEGRIKALLAKPVTFRGSRTTKGRMVEAMVTGGAILKVDRYPKYQYSRTVFNRLDGQAQRDYEEKLKIKEPYVAEFPDGTFYALTQTEAKYFLSLGGKS